MRELADVIDQLSEAITSNGQMTLEISKNLYRINYAQGWRAPELYGLGWGELRIFLADTFKDDNPHIAEYKKIFRGV